MSNNEEAKFEYILNKLIELEKKTYGWPLYDRDHHNPYIKRFYTNAFRKQLVNSVDELKKLIKFLESTDLDEVTIRKFLMFVTYQIPTNDPMIEQYCLCVQAFIFKHRVNQNVYNLCKDNIDKILYV